MPRPRSAVATPLALALCLAGLGLLGAWVRPQGPTKLRVAAARGRQLDYIIVAVNGEPRLVHAGEELAIVRGDKVVVQSGALFDPQVKARELNVVGYQNNGPNRNDDRGYLFDTAQDLKVKWSEGAKGVVYAVVATSKSELHGTIYLRLIDPLLRYAELSINGKHVVLRDGEVATVSAKDRVKVERVATNLQSNDGVLFQIVPSPPLRAPDAAPDAPDAAAAPATVAGDYEIRFLRGDRPFAAIPLKVKD